MLSEATLRPSLCGFLFSFFFFTASYDALGDKTQDKDITSLIFSNIDK